MKRLWHVWFLALALLSGAPAFACTTGACVAAGPRIASVDSTRGVLINALLGRLTNSTLSVSALDWNSVATGSVSLAKFVGAGATAASADG